MNDHPSPTGRSSCRTVVLGAAAAVLTTICALVAISVDAGSRADPTGVAAWPTSEPVPTTPAGPAPTVDVTTLPWAVHDAVIPGLLASGDGPVASTGRLASDVVVTGADRATAVARLPAVDVTGEPTVVAVVRHAGDKALVLTPARQRLPSEAGDGAPAQTAGWIDRAALRDEEPVRANVTVSVSRQVMTVLDGSDERTFEVGVGAPDTPTPVGVTGYLQARYLDPAQDQTRLRIQLTSLHATTSDEPYGGSDGGLIGLHHAPVTSGPVSHGCVRLPAEALEAVDRLPLGTPVTMEG